MPVPAKVEIAPPGVTFRIRLLPESAMYRFPAASTAIPSGNRSWAAVAGPPSPENPLVPLPATVVMVPPVEIIRTRWLNRSTTYTCPPGPTATSAGSCITALVAAPPSPASGSPANVVMSSAAAWTGTDPPSAAIARVAAIAATRRRDMVRRFRAWPWSDGGGDPRESPRPARDGSTGLPERDRETECPLAGRPRGPSVPSGRRANDREAGGSMTPARVRPADAGRARSA